MTARPAALSSWRRAVRAARWLLGCFALLYLAVIVGTEMYANPELVIGGDEAAPETKAVGVSFVLTMLAVFGLVAVMWWQGSRLGRKNEDLRRRVDAGEE